MKHSDKQKLFFSCIFCQKIRSEGNFLALLNKALYCKYCSSQNYFYSKNINDILSTESTAIVVKYKDLEVLDESEEYLKRFYKMEEYNFKNKALNEYYKYHKDVPRIFIKLISDIMNRFHDKKRRFEYKRIKIELNLEISNNKSDEEDSEFSQSNSQNSEKKKEIG